MKLLQPKGGTPITNHVPKRGPIAKARKSRDGCRRCKQRRRKCGEEKPECRRCVVDKVPCPGYTKDFRWSSKYEVLKSPDVPAPGMSSQILAPPSGTSHVASSEAVTTKPTEIVISPGELTSSLEDSYEQAPISTQVTVPSQQFSVLEESIGYDAGALELPDLESPFTAPEQALDPLPTELTSGFDSPILAFPDNVGNQISHQDTLDTFEDSLQNQQAYEEIEEVVCQTETSLMPLAKHHRPTSSNSSHAPEDLLKWYYRMIPSQYSDSDLVEHYFSQVCRLYALFDSTINPFRALVGRNWDNSGSITLAIQSMSCAHLANSDTAMVRVGLSKQRQARISIQNDLQLWRSGNITADRLLLAILLLGPTVSWHNPSDLGLEYLNIARELINTKLAQSNSLTDTNNKALEQFFMHAMIYWEMMISFVDFRDDDLASGSASLSASLQQLNMGPATGFNLSRNAVKPHPWTGIAPHVQMLFAEVGRIIRRHVIDGDAPFATESEVIWAMAIEKALMDAVIPSREDVLDSEDQNTPEDHFVQLAEAYRCAGLLQIYHVFPTVLAGRLMAMGDGEVGVSVEARTRYRVDLALHTLNLVEALPLSSGTSCLHPILVLTAGSELKYLGETIIPAAEDLIADQGIASGRDFAEKRLSDLARRLPQQPFLRMLDIMRETWLQMDLFNVEVHWMEVMCQKGWETIMG